MAKFTFNYSVMNAGKSLHLLQVNNNYVTNGKKTILLKPSIDTRSSKIESRLGVSSDCINIGPTDKVIDFIDLNHLECVLIDEAQFLTRDQVIELAKLCDTNDVHIMAYGLKVNSFGELFDGSKALLEFADNLNEIKQMCHCGNKATMILRFDEDGNIIKEGNSIQVGAEDMYQSVCRKHWFGGMN